jgi:AcrR family transcriptional regulator
LSSISVSEVTEPIPASSPTRGTPKPDAARARLLEAGTRLIAERGVESVNSNVIARAAGVGVGTFYNHFPDKHALHRAAVTQAVDGLQSALASTASQIAGRAVVDDQVRPLVEAAIDWAIRHPDLFRLAFGRSARGSAAGGPALGLSSHGIEVRLAGLQREGRLDPSVDPGLAARAFTAMQTHVIVWWLEASERPSRERLVETLVRLHPAIACRPPG